MSQTQSLKVTLFKKKEISSIKEEEEKKEIIPSIKEEKEEKKEIIPSMKEEKEEKKEIIPSMKEEEKKEIIPSMKEKEKEEESSSLKMSKLIITYIQKYFDDVVNFSEIDTDDILKKIQIIIDTNPVSSRQSCLGITKEGHNCKSTIGLNIHGYCSNHAKNDPNKHIIEAKKIAKQSTSPKKNGQCCYKKPKEGVDGFNCNSKIGLSDIVHNEITYTFCSVHHGKALKAFSAGEMPPMIDVSLLTEEQKSIGYRKSHVHAHVHVSPTST
jgi:hypothetical protein